MRFLWKLKISSRTALLNRIARDRPIPVPTGDWRCGAGGAGRESVRTRSSTDCAGERTDFQNHATGHAPFADSNTAEFGSKGVWAGGGERQTDRQTKTYVRGRRNRGGSER